MPKGTLVAIEHGVDSLERSQDPTAQVQLRLECLILRWYYCTVYAENFGYTFSADCGECLASEGHRAADVQR